MHPKAQATVESLQAKIGQTLNIQDQLSSNGRNYNRHWTRFGQYQFTLEECRVRFSGAMVSLCGQDQQLEFQLDCIVDVSEETELLIIESQLGENVWRRLELRFT